VLNGKQIVVTGCASGIGQEVARLAKKHGARVLGVDLAMTQDHVDEHYRADLTDPYAIQDLVRLLPRGIDGLVNSAGLPPTHPAAKVLKANLIGLKRLTLDLMPKMNEGASVVNLASLAGIGWPNQVSSILEADALDFDNVQAFVANHDAGDPGGRSYFFSKEALIAWTMRNRWTWRERNIRMNCVSPGPVATPILQDFLDTLGARAEEDAKVMDRPGQAQDIAPVVIFLLSDGSGWIRGTNIPVDGGMSSHIMCANSGLIS
jgi:NAD(P)-dependent dehydrogenase (short-subunit alcohol dehydrogenase family)